MQNSEDFVCVTVTQAEAVTTDHEGAKHQGVSWSHLWSGFTPTNLCSFWQPFVSVDLDVIYCLVFGADLCFLS